MNYCSFTRRCAPLRPRGRRGWVGGDARDSPGNASSAEPPTSPDPSAPRAEGGQGRVEAGSQTLRELLARRRLEARPLGFVGLDARGPALLPGAALLEFLFDAGI